MPWRKLPADETRVAHLFADPVPSSIGLARNVSEEAAPAYLPIKLAHKPDRAQYAGLVAATALNSTSEDAIDIAYATDRSPCPPGYLSDWVPLRLQAADDTSFAALATKTATQVERARTHSAFALDLVARDPAIAAITTPELGLSETHEGELIAGTALTIHLSENDMSLFYDSARIDLETAQLFAARIEQIAAAVAQGGDPAVASIQTISDQEPGIRDPRLERHTSRL